MHVSYLALVVGVLGLVFGLASPRLDRRQSTIGAMALLGAAILLIGVPLMMGVPW